MGPAGGEGPAHPCASSSPSPTPRHLWLQPVWAEQGRVRQQRLCREHAVAAGVRHACICVRKVPDVAVGQHRDVERLRGGVHGCAAGWASAWGLWDTMRAR